MSAAQQLPELTVDLVVAIHTGIMQESGDAPALLLDPGKLESALRRPAMAYHYEQADLAQQVTVLIEGVAIAHAFLDGNKRTATATGEFVLRLLGWRIASPTASDTTLGRRVEQLVAIHTSETVAAFTAWLRANIVALPQK